MTKSTTTTPKHNAKSAKQQLSEAEKQQLELGKKVQAMFEMGYVNKQMAIGMSFAKGVASGFGAIVGATIVLAIVLWFLSLFNQIPFVDKIQRALESGSSIRVDENTKQITTP